MSFDRAVQFVLRQEGGLVEDPADPGGLTNFGIALNHHPELTADDIRHMTIDRAVQIYHESYWNVVQGDKLPDGIDIGVLDAAVNQGPSVAVHCLQYAVGTTQDGVIGPATISAAHSQALGEESSRAMVAHFTAKRVQYYAASPQWARFGAGWTSRAVEAALESHA